LLARQRQEVALVSHAGPAVDAQGAVAIELGSALVLRERMLAQLSIASVAPAAGEFAKPGVSLGQIELTRCRDTSREATVGMAR
jgi:hypothetical protein